MTGRYYRGTKPLKDTCWQAFVIGADDWFEDVGRAFKVSGKEVKREMQKARSIKGHTPNKIALRKARKKHGNRIAGVDRVACKRRRK